MLRLLSAEGYKLRRSRAFFISAIVMASFVILIYAMFMLVDETMKGNIDNGTAGVVVTQEGREIAEQSGSIWEELSIMEIMQQIFSGDLIACVLAVYVSVVVVSEHTSGMVKNIVGKGSPRAAVFLSKLIMAVLSSLLLALIGCVTVLVLGLIFIGKSALAGDFWQNLLIFVGLQMLLTAALAALYVLVAEVTRGYAAGISAGIGVAVFPVLLFNGLDIVCEKYGFTPSQYWLVSRSGNCPASGFTTDFIIETVLVAAIWFVAAAVLGMWHFYKADVK